MGNLLSKRRKVQPEPAGKEKGIKLQNNNLEFIQSKPKGEEKVTNLRRNNLELYLNHVHEKECKFKPEKEEVDFIQKGIETLVQEIVDPVLENCTEHLPIPFNNYLLDDDLKEETRIYFHEPLVEFYFPKKRDSHFQKYIFNLKPVKSAIIEVGSFYERTKNHFPHEFDFIFLLFCGRRVADYKIWDFMSRTARRCIINVTGNKALHFKASLNGKREIYFNSETPILPHGPACMLQFIYKDASGKERNIYVDLVPAYKITVSNQPEWYVKHVNKYVKPKSFHDIVLSAESCLYVGENITFTELEVSFIRKVLSKHHKKVYRILKFLINGHGDDKTLEYLTAQDESAYTSYQIKTMMIHHHDECRNSDTTNLGPCVLQVMEEMCRYDTLVTFPELFERMVHKHKLCLVDYLQSLIKTLRMMQNSEDKYSYGRYRTTSVTMQYMKREHPDMLERIRESLDKHFLN